MSEEERRVQGRPAEGSLAALRAEWLDRISTALGLTGAEGRGELAGAVALARDLAQLSYEARVTRGRLDRLERLYERTFGLEGDGLLIDAEGRNHLVGCCRAADGGPCTCGAVGAKEDVTDARARRNRR